MPYQLVARPAVPPSTVFRAFPLNVSSPRANPARPGLMSKYKWKTEDEAKKNVKVYGAYQELLADPDIDAVVIALPLHLHSVAAIQAMRAGRLHVARFNTGSNPISVNCGGLLPLPTMYSQNHDFGLQMELIATAYAHLPQNSDLPGPTAVPPRQAH